MKVIECESVLSRMLDDAKLVPVRLEPWPTWKVFKAFMQVPVECEGDAASFQCSVAEDESGDDHFFVEFIRQCSVTEEEEDTPVAGVGIELIYDLKSLPVTDDRQVWSHEYDSLAAFAAYVESLPEFQAAMNARPTATELWLREV